MYIGVHDKKNQCRFGAHRVPVKQGEFHLGESMVIRREETWEELEREDEAMGMVREGRIGEKT